MLPLFADSLGFPDGVSSDYIQFRYYLRHTPNLQMPLLSPVVHIHLVLDPFGPPMWSVLVKKVDWWTVVLTLTQPRALMLMMQESLAMLRVSYMQYSKEREHERKFKSYSLICWIS